MDEGESKVRMDGVEWGETDEGADSGTKKGGKAHR